MIFNKRYFFVGIGGIGMSALALFLKHHNGWCAGCDFDLAQDTIYQLQRNNIFVVAQGNALEYILQQDINAFIITNTVKDSCEIMKYAIKNNIEIILRGDFLAQCINDYNLIAITGSHGKTTTTGMVAHIMINQNTDPTVFTGGILHELKSNFKAGNSSIAIVEADDAYKSFLYLKPQIAGINNISYEHLETYNDWNDIIATFKQFMDKVRVAGKIVLNADDECIAKNLLSYRSDNTQTISLKNINADFFVSKYVLYENYSLCSLFFENKEYRDIYIPMAGIHNIYNAIMAIALTYNAGLVFENIFESLKTYKGTARRFDLIGVTDNGVSIYDDYAHHPKELNALFDTIAKKWRDKKVVVVFQPHKYTRTKNLWDEFIAVITKYTFEKIIITDVFAAGDEHDAIHNSEALVQACCQASKNNIIYLPASNNFNIVLDYCNNYKHLLRNNDALFFVGAGKLDFVAKKMLYNNA